MRYYSKILLIVSLFIYIFLRFLLPIYKQSDTDIFWHLKTGELIYKEQGLLASDPFNYTPSDPLREKFATRAYWLADLLFYIIYKTGGFTGLSILRSLIFCLTILFVYLAVLKRGFFLSIILSLLLCEYLISVSPLKPNILSFLFIAAQIFFIERYRTDHSRRYQIGLFLVMLLWANMHGGYIFGVIILLIYIFSEAISFLFFKKRSPSLFITAGIAILFTLINPSDISSCLVIKDIYTHPGHKVMKSLVAEHIDFLELLKRYIGERTFLNFILGGIVLIFGALNLTRKKAGIAETLIIISLLGISVSSIRVLPLFMIAGLILSAGKEWYGILNIKINKKIEALLTIALLSLTVFLIFKHPPKGDFDKLKETTVMYLKVGGFLKENRINGNILNNEVTGNFFVFDLFPQYKVFTDTRYKNYDVMLDAFKMFAGFEKPETAEKEKYSYYKGLSDLCILKMKGEEKKDYSQEYWYRLLKKYEIDFIVGRATHPLRGALYPIFLKLMNDDTWKLIYMDGNSIIMINDNGKNDEILKRFRPLDKTLLYNQAVLENRFSEDELAYETVAFALLMKGEYEMAERYAKDALKLNKNLRIARASLEYINLKKKEKIKEQPEERNNK